MYNQYIQNMTMGKKVATDSEFLAALAALYLTLVSEWVSESVTDRHFRILTQIVTFETWHPSDIWLFKKRWRKNWFVWKKEVEKSWKKSVKKKHKKTEKCWNFKKKEVLGKGSEMWKNY